MTKAFWWGAEMVDTVCSSEEFFQSRYILGFWQSSECRILAGMPLERVLGSGLVEKNVMTAANEHKCKTSGIQAFTFTPRYYGMKEESSFLAFMI